MPNKTYIYNVARQKEIFIGFLNLCTGFIEARNLESISK